MNPDAGKKGVEPPAFTAFLQLLADSRWVSKRVFRLWLTDPKWRGEVVRRMQDEGYATCRNLNAKRRKGKDRSEETPAYVYGLRYALTKKGRDYLESYNPKRYTQTDALTPYEYDERKIYRLSMLAEMRVMAERAGFSVHAHTKPHPVVLSAFPLAPAERPACSAFAATKLPDRYVGFENTVFNTSTFRYYTKNKRTHGGYVVQDRKEYTRRETPIGCVYTLPELRTLAEWEAQYLGANKEELDMMRYTRLSGVFFSGNGLYRIYNTERTAMKLRKNGEDAMQSMLNAWAQTIYRRSLTIMREDGQGNLVAEPLAPQVRGALLFGDESHQAAVNVILQTMQNALGFGGANQIGKTIANYNLCTVPNTYYLPVIQEALPVYALMVLPHWPMYLKELGKDWLRRLHAKGEAPCMKREYLAEEALDGELEDGSTLVTLVALHLDTVHWMIGELSMPQSRFTVVAMEWQRVFFEKLFAKLPPEMTEKLKVLYLPQEELEHDVAELHRKIGVAYGI